VSNIAAPLVDTPKPGRQTGPRTPEGKARSSLNALKHGLTSRHLVVREDEREAFEELRADYLRDVGPQGVIESDLFNLLLHAAWNLRRLRRLEAELSPEGADPLTDPNLERQLDRLARYQARAENLYFRTLKQLRELQTDRVSRRNYDEVMQTQLPSLVSMKELTKRNHPQPVDLWLVNLEREARARATRPAGPSEARIATQT